MYRLNKVTHESAPFTEDMCKINVKSTEKLVSEPLSFFTHTYNTKFSNVCFVKWCQEIQSACDYEVEGFNMFSVFLSISLSVDLEFIGAHHQICFFTLSQFVIFLSVPFFTLSVKWLLLYCSLFYCLWLFSHMKPTHWNSHVKTSSVVALSRSW